MSLVIVGHPRLLCQWHDGEPCCYLRPENEGNVIHMYCPAHTIAAEILTGGGSGADVDKHFDIAGFPEEITK